jgi:hypothetical protein
MDKEEIELLISARVSEAKAEIWEKRFKWAGGVTAVLLTVFGGILPYIITTSNTEKVERVSTELRQEQQLAMDRYRSEFDRESGRLASQSAKSVTDLQTEVDKTLKQIKSDVSEVIGKQLRKPDLILTYNNKDVEGSELLPSAQTSLIMLALRNIGDAKAENIKLRLYLDTMQTITGFGGEDGSFWICYTEPSSDEPGYHVYLERNVPILKVDPKDFALVSIQLDQSWFGRNQVKALLKVSYGEPEPKKYHFTIRFK